MKKIIVSALLSACGVAFAASPYDGVFQERDEVGSYLSVHTNGNVFIGTLYNIDLLNGVPVALFNGLRPRQLNTWNLLQGSLSGNVANVSGELLLNHCKVNAQIAFTTTTALVTVQSATSTPLGQEVGVNCAKQYPAGDRFIFDLVRAARLGVQPEVRAIKPVRSVVFFSRHNL